MWSCSRWRMKDFFLICTYTFNLSALKVGLFQKEVFSSESAQKDVYDVNRSPAELSTVCLWGWRKKFQETSLFLNFMGLLKLVASTADSQQLQHENTPTLLNGVRILYRYIWLKCLGITSYLATTSMMKTASTHEQRREGWRIMVVTNFKHAYSDFKQSAVVDVAT